MVSENVKLTEKQAEVLKRQKELCAMLDEAKAGGMSDRTAEATWTATEERHRKNDDGFASD